MRAYRGIGEKEMAEYVCMYVPPKQDVGVVLGNKKGREKVRVFFLKIVETGWRLYFC